MALFKYGFKRRDSVKVDLCVQLAMKLFCLKTSMVYSNKLGYCSLHMDSELFTSYAMLYCITGDQYGQWLHVSNTSWLYDHVLVQVTGYHYYISWHHDVYRN